MATWADLLAEIREDLQDTGETPRWSDAILYLYAKDGIRDYSTWFPMRVDHHRLTAQNGAYALPSDFIDEIFVECPTGTFLERRQERSGVRFNSTAVATHYYIQGGNLYLVAPTSNDVFLTYFASHPVPETVDDDDFEVTIPDKDIELIRLYIKAKVYSQMRSRQSALDRFKVTSGKRDDNPLEPEVDGLMRDYQRGIYQRMSGGTVMLYRIGKKK